MAKRASRLKSQHGFTLVEMMIVAGIIIVTAVMALPVSARMIRDAKGDTSAVLAATFMSSARNRAVSERRNIEMTFVMPNRIRLERIEVPTNVRTFLSELTLEGNQEFVKDAAMPDTLDASGGGPTVAINFTGVTPVMFTSDGSLIDAAGDVANGTIFIGRPNFPETARAVTISGMTGLLRTWKWRGNRWLQ
jgi:type II secretory pathway pseudopilin PulG